MKYVLLEVKHTHYYLMVLLIMINSTSGIINEKANNKKQVTFNDYVDVLFSDKNIKRSQFTLRMDHLNVYAEKINKIALSSNDDKRIQANDKITTYPYGYFDNNEIVDIKENNTKTVLDILREEPKALRNNSKILREEVNNIIKGSHIIKEDNTKSEVDILREEYKVLRNNSIILREEANTIRNNSKVLREEINDIIKEPKALRNNPTILREDAQAIQNNFKIHREEVNNIIKEYHAIKENTTKSEIDILREEANALRNDSIILREKANTIRNNSKVFREAVNNIMKESHATENKNAIHRKKISDNTHTKIIKFQKDYILLVKDIEISSTKFICDQFLYPKFREKLSDELE